ncbi:HAD family hydrolase [Streptomyces sp. NBC_00249]|uniref:HAD family hydrolase n=1 Tax=Streptomyces sp. NBC_00249 TaxID=2975690 RepID=UPI00225B6588|nr:HAD family hydrolase [Streptomyces sp. NBC_00249]MCX5195914.1 HAD family hydrolase [Streptomyces sp. NBC_00249]
MPVKDRRLVVLDFGGVIRDSSAGLHEGYRAGFAKVGLPFDFRIVDTWHLRGIGKYDIGLECIKVLLSLQLAGENHRLPEILATEDAESALDRLTASLDEETAELAEEIRLGYKEFFNSAAAGLLVGMYPGAEEAVHGLKEKGYLVALLTNGNRVTVDRDLPFADAFDLIASEDDVAAKKPSGKGLVHIMNELSVTADETVFVCDAPNDIHAGQDADVACVAVLSGMGLLPHLESARPDHITESLVEFVSALPVRATPGETRRADAIGGA